MKDLNDIKKDMSALYEELRSGRTELKTAAELANIAGKFLKADQLQLAREMFLANRGEVIDLPTDKSDPPLPAPAKRLTAAKR